MTPVLVLDPAWVLSVHFSSLQDYHLCEQLFMEVVWPRNAANPADVFFTLTKRNPDQKYCSKPECQKERKRLWQKKKMQVDEDYRLNKKDSDHRWSAKNSDYWSNYREDNPDYTQRNREKQRHRNRRRRATRSISSEIAKLDALSAENRDISGIYGLISVQDLLIAKLDAKLVKITEISMGCT